MTKREERNLSVKEIVERRKHGSFDYDLFVIDPNNGDSSYNQVRDCVKDALEQLEERIHKLEGRTQNE